MSPARVGDQWNERYSSEQYRYGVIPNEFLARTAPLLPKNAKVLSLAEGEGRNAVFLASLGHRVTGVDASSVGMQKAQRLAAGRGVKIETVVAELAEYVIEPGAWDAVVSIFCHLPPDLRRRVFRAAVEGLRPGGLMILEAYTPRQLELRTGGPPVPELLYTADALREDFGGLELTRLEELEREVHEGDLHNGRSAVVQLVGVKPPAR